MQDRIDGIVAGHVAAPTGFAGYLAAIADHLDGEGSNAVLFADGQTSIELVTAIYAAARSGQAVTLPLPCGSSDVAGLAAGGGVMRETWRWFGPPDPITLAEVRQTGAVGIVSALHHVPSGMAWRTDEVAARKGEIEAAGLTWDVIESIPVSEPIKTRTGPWRAHIDAWIASLRAVAEAAGPRVIC